MEFLPIEELRAQAEAEAIRRQKMKEEIEKKKQYLQEVRHLRAEAINNGDMVAYEKLKDEPEYSKIELKNMENDLNKIGFNRAEFLASWNHHIRIKNNAFNKKVEAYKQARQALCLQFLELAEMQLEAQNDAHIIAAALETDAYARMFSYGVFARFPDDMERPAYMDGENQRVLLNNRRSFPDVAMYIEAGELPDGSDLNTAMILNAALIWHTPTDPDDIKKIKERTLAKMNAKRK